MTEDGTFFYTESNGFDIIREKLNLTALELPLVKVLQRGTWIAGRKIAKELRKDGATPIKIKSDGTVF